MSGLVDGVGGGGRGFHCYFNLDFPYEFYYSCLLFMSGSIIR